jgi:anti-sigma-K factor RskA
MTNKISNREWEALSAYLDKQLSARERSRLEARLKENPELRQALEEMRRVRTILRSQPKMRAPRNFTLTPEMVGMRRRPARRSRAYPVFRLASVLATLLFVLVLVGDFVTGSGSLTSRESASAPQVVAMATEQAGQVEEAQRAAPPGFGGGAEPEQEQEAPKAFEVPQEQPAEQGTPTRPPGAMMLQQASPAPSTESQLVPEPTMVPPGEATPRVAAPLVGKSYPSEGESLQADEGLMGQAEQAQPFAEPLSEEAQEQGSNIEPWRIAEISLAVLAVLTGLTALILRRIGNP